MFYDLKYGKHFLNVLNNVGDKSVCTPTKKVRLSRVLGHIFYVRIKIKDTLSNSTAI